MRSVSFKAGDTIIAEGDDGDTAFLIVAGAVDVSVGIGADSKSVGILGPGDVFGEMSLIDPTPRSATVKALADTECLVTDHTEFLTLAATDPAHAAGFTQTLVRRLRQMNERLARMRPETGQRIQQYLQVIIAGLGGHDTLTGAVTEA